DPGRGDGAARPGDRDAPGAGGDHAAPGADGHCHRPPAWHAAARGRRAPPGARPRRGIRPAHPPGRGYRLALRRPAADRVGGGGRVTPAPAGTPAPWWYVWRLARYRPVLYVVSQ